MRWMRWRKVRDQGCATAIAVRPNALQSAVRASAIDAPTNCFMKTPPLQCTGSRKQPIAAIVGSSGGTLEWNYAVKAYR